MSRAQLGRGLHLPVLSQRFLPRVGTVTWPRVLGLSRGRESASQGSPSCGPQAAGEGAEPMGPPGPRVRHRPLLLLPPEVGVGGARSRKGHR